MNTRSGKTNQNSPKKRFGDSHMPTKEDLEVLADSKTFMQRVEGHANAHPGIWMGAIAVGLILLGVAGFTNFGGFFEDSANNAPVTEGK